MSTRMPTQVKRTVVTRESLEEVEARP
jgi:hypothetical protein